MDEKNKENSAINIVKKTFQNSFDKDSFVYFIKNLLNHIDETKAFHARGYVQKKYKKQTPIIKTYERIGTYIDSEDKKIDVLIVYLQKNNSIDRARTTLRNFVADYLKGRGEKDAALVAFVAPNPEDWRFSLVKMDYRIDVSEKKVKIKQELTPARRFSFLVGKNESSHTAQSCLAPILQDDVDNPTLKQLEESFNIEKVTKEFFGKYKELFEMIVKKLEGNHTFKNEAVKNNINTENFAKKLLGQIVFLYFLQKKGWLGVPVNKSWGDGDRYFLHHLFNEAKTKSKNFFNDYLEILFYDTLNNPRRNTSDPSFSKYFNSRIPFLNGGLFEPEYDWKNSFIYLDDSLFEKIINVFDLYNFTVKEDEPLEKEVAVDPEMLGKVFENLLEENLRKGKGTYYTPREIVHYMCQESLINYLTTEHSNLSEENIRTYVKCGEALSKDFSELKKVWKGEWFTPGQWKELDDLLKNIKVVDPACGSGAFLVGMLQEIVKLRLFLQLTLDSELFSNNPKNSIKEISEYNLRKETIQNCIYGVDIDPGAVEIAKLRLWLSLVVDYGLEEIEPLPNLDYKIMQGNSLLEELVLGDTSIKLFDFRINSNDKMKNLFDKERQTDLFGESNKQKEIVEELSKLHREYFEISDLEEKRKKKVEIDKIEQDLIKKSVKKEVERIERENKSLGNYIIPGVGMTKKDATRLQKNLSKQAQIMNVLRELKNSGVKPFFLWRLYFADVFENKGRFDIVIANPPYVKEYVNKSAFDGLRMSPYYQGKMDLWYMFACRGIDLVKERVGIVTFIAQNNWVTSYGASKMRDKVIRDTQILSLADFGDFKVFETAGIQTMVMMFRKDNSKKEYTFDYRRIIYSRPVLDDIVDLLDKRESQNTEYLKPLINRERLLGKKFVFSDSEIESVLNKISSNSNFQLKEKEVAQGIVAAPDKYFIINDLSGFNKKELHFIKPFYTSTNKYNLKNMNLYIFYLCNKNFQDKDINNYPNIKKHFQNFKKQLQEAKSKYGTPQKPYFYLHRERDESFFKKGPKIAGQTRTHFPRFLYTENEYYGSRAMNFIKTNRIDLKYLVGLLNSKLIYMWLKNKGKKLGSMLHIDKEPILELPLIKPNEGDQKRIRKIIDKILIITKDDDYLTNSIKQAKVRDYEKQIDQLVYKLYDLTEEEIKVVRKSH